MDKILFYKSLQLFLFSLMLWGLVASTACTRRPTGGSSSLASGHARPHTEEQQVIQVEELAFRGATLPTVSLLQQAQQLAAHYECHSQIVAVSATSQPLVQQCHSFFGAVQKAYADHRPIVISPDAVWLLVCQGFAQHVASNAEELRSLFVNFEGKKTLRLYVPPSLIRRSGKAWEPYFEQFSSQIGGIVGPQLTQTLATRFSTSTTASLTASQITTMAAFKSYFDYSPIEMCGIPTVILQGTPADWHTIVQNTQSLRGYNLDWWVDALLPVLQKLEQASLGEVDKSFWLRMYKFHELEHEMCGDPYTCADGWIGRFYPYDVFGLPRLKAGQSASQMEVIHDPASQLPGELVNAPLVYVDTRDCQIRLTLWAGFVGVSEDPHTHALKPQIGWFITKE